MRTDRLRRTKRILRILAGFLMALAVVYVSWSVWANLPPDVSIPPQKLPKTNGYDYYVQATKMINAADQERLYERIGGTSRQPLSQIEKEELLAHVGGAIAKAREGKNYHCVIPIEAWPRQVYFTGLCEAFVLESEVRAENGNWRGAMVSCLDLMDIISDLSLNYDIDRVALQFWKILPHSDSLTTKEALTRATKLVDNTRPFSDKVREDNLRKELQLLDIFRGNDWRAMLESSYDCQCMDTFTHDREWRICRYSSKRLIMKDWIITSRQLIKNAALPFATMPVYPPKHEFFHLYGEDLVRRRASREICNTEHRFVLIALALRAYQLEHHTYPASLTGLVPGYLSNLPADPFAAKGTFRYVNKGKNYLLYSLGPDGKDDGGKLFIDSFRAYSHSWYKDIVAGEVISL